MKRLEWLFSRSQEEGPCRPEAARLEGEISSGREHECRWWERTPLPTGLAAGGTSPIASLWGEKRMSRVSQKSRFQPTSRLPCTRPAVTAGGPMGRCCNETIRPGSRPGPLRLRLA